MEIVCLIIKKVAENRDAESIQKNPNEREEKHAENKYLNKNNIIILQ
jgi:hypothetical protein